MSLAVVSTVTRVLNLTPVNSPKEKIRMWNVRIVIWKTIILKAAFASHINPKTRKSAKISTVLAVSAGVCILVVAGLIWLVTANPGKNNETVSSEATTNTQLDVTTPKPSPPQVPKTEEEQIDALEAKPVLMSSEEKTSRDNILKALLNVQSATALGVARDKFGDLLTTALSTLSFEKTKLSAERHEKFLECADKAIHYYTKANDEWSDYFKYDWMRDKNETFMYQYDFDDLRQNGVNVDATQYSHDANVNEAFVVPFDDCLSLYWKAADVYIEKMKDDVQQ